MIKPVVDEKHWHLLAFMVQSPGVWTPHSVVVGSEDQNLTLPQLVNLKKAHNVPDASVLMGISYLGWMTERQINGQPDVDPPTILSEAYRQGMVAAARVNPTDPSQPVNPYDAIDPNIHIRAKAAEWQAGFTATRTAQNDSQTLVIRQELAKTPDSTGIKATGEIKPSTLNKP